MAIRDKRLAQRYVHKAFSLFFILLITSGIWNVVFSGTLLSGWKQAVVIISYVMCFPLIKKYSDLLRLTFFLTIFIQIALVFASLFSGMAVEVTFYNVFYYAAWVPFFIWAARSGADYYLDKYRKFTFFLVIACGIGLIIDSKTDLFLFLASRSDELDMSYFVEHSEVVKRSAFIFTTSTLVAPVFGGMIVVSWLEKLSLLRAAMGGMAMLLAILASAATNSVVIVSGLILGVLLQMGLKPARVIGVALAFLMAVYFVFPFLGGEQFIEKQFSQILEHRSLESEGNAERIILWNQGLDDIQEFSGVEHIFGSGLGSTNANGGNRNVLHTHGESSFIQAYLEGGIFGLTLRMLPFLLIAYLVKRNKSGKRPYIILGYATSVFITDAIAPIFGNIPSQVLLGFMMGALYSATRSNTDQIKRRAA